MGQVGLFSRAQVPGMRGRTKSRRYSPEAERFRQEHAPRRDWGLQQRHGHKLRRLRRERAEAAAPTTPEPARATPAPARVAPQARPHYSRPSLHHSQARPHHSRITPASARVTREPRPRGQPTAGATRAAHPGRAGHCPAEQPSRPTPAHAANLRAEQPPSPRARGRPPSEQRAASSEQRAASSEQRAASQPCAALSPRGLSRRQGSAGTAARPRRRNPARYPSAVLEHRAASQAKHCSGDNSSPGFAIRFLAYSWRASRRASPFPKPTTNRHLARPAQCPGPRSRIGYRAAITGGICGKASTAAVT